MGWAWTNLILARLLCDRRYTKPHWTALAKYCETVTKDSCTTCNFFNLCYLVLGKITLKLKVLAHAWGAALLSGPAIVHTDVKAMIHFTHSKGDYQFLVCYFFSSHNMMRNLEIITFCSGGQDGVNFWIYLFT